MKKRKLALPRAKRSGQDGDFGVVQVQKRGLISVGKVKDVLRLQEGDLVQLTVKAGVLEVRPVVAVPRDEAYVHTPTWRSALAQAAEDSAVGRVRKFGGAAEAVKELDRFAETEESD